MSTFTMPQGTASAQPKQISSRLLNMKFMQRAAATSAQKTPSTPGTSTGEPALKRRRTGDFESSLNSPSTTTSTPSYNDRANGAVGAQGIVIKRGTNNFDLPGEETQWTLDVHLTSVNGANGNHHSDSASDSEEQEEDEIWSSTAPTGRQTYGSFDKKKKRKSTDPSSTPSATSQNTRKRSHSDDDEDLSSISSNSDSSSDGEIVEEVTNPKKKGTPGKFDMKSEADLKRMDAFDFQKAGAGHGLGRQRRGLGGGGGFDSPHRGGGGGGGGGSSKHKNKKKARKTM